MFPAAAAFLDAQELYMDQDSTLPAYGEGDFAMNLDSYFGPLTFYRFSVGVN